MWRTASPESAKRPVSAEHAPVRPERVEADLDRQHCPASMHSGIVPKGNGCHSMPVLRIAHKCAIHVSHSTVSYQMLFEVRVSELPNDLTPLHRDGWWKFDCTWRVGMRLSGVQPGLTRAMIPDSLHTVLGSAATSLIAAGIQNRIGNIV